MDEIQVKSKHPKKLNWFYILLMVIPVAQFVIFYIFVNVKSFGYAFMSQEKISDTEIIWKFTFDNFADWFTNPTKLETLLNTTKISLLFFAINFLVCIPTGLLFSYYIFKKHFGSKLFRVFLFLPSIIPAAALCLSYKIILNDVTPVILGTQSFRFDDNQLWSLIFYNVFVSFGSSVLMYSNKMAEISPEIIDAAKIDGAIGFKEFWYVVLPFTYPTLSVFLITGIATMFTNQYNFFLFQADPQWRNLGYYLYDITSATVGHEQDIPNVAALGLILTAVAIPLTFGAKALIEKLGPKE